MAAKWTRRSQGSRRAGTAGRTRCGRFLTPRAPTAPAHGPRKTACHDAAAPQPASPLQSPKAARRSGRHRPSRARDKQTPTSTTAAVPATHAEPCQLLGQHRRGAPATDSPTSQGWTPETAVRPALTMIIIGGWRGRLPLNATVPSQLAAKRRRLTRRPGPPPLI